MVPCKAAKVVAPATAEGAKTAASSAAESWIMCRSFRQRRTRAVECRAMGKVVKLEPASKRRPRGPVRPLTARGVGRPASSERRRRPRRDKTALVLGGGGFTGGVYEIGALRALDLLAVNSTVNNFDVYVGTSAGSFIAALCANGVTPEEMMRVVTRQGKPPFKDIDIGDLLRPNVLEFARKGALLPLRAASLARQLVSQWGG